MRTYLKEIRKLQRLTQSDVAQQLGIAQNTYAMIENGERQQDMNLSLLEKLAKVFRVPIEWVLENERRLKKQT